MVADFEHHRDVQASAAESSARIAPAPALSSIRSSCPPPGCAELSHDPDREENAPDEDQNKHRGTEISDAPHSGRLEHLLRASGTASGWPVDKRTIFAHDLAESVSSPVTASTRRTGWTSSSPSGRMMTSLRIAELTRRSRRTRPSTGSSSTISRRSKSNSIGAPLPKKKFTCTASLGHADRVSDTPLAPGSTVRTQAAFLRASRSEPMSASREPTTSPSDRGGDTGDRGRGFGYLGAPEPWTRCSP
ncbi:hypothetical protein GA0004736_2041 [Curtobacterium sp. 9128]|nr:hypothetical protein GA0004736_2041 [Curtobacterium sp. 9128]